MSAVIRACAILARSFDSGSGNAGLGIPHQDALEASVAARTEHDAMVAAIQSAEQRELTALAELDECRAELAEANATIDRETTATIHWIHRAEAAESERDTARVERDALHGMVSRQADTLIERRESLAALQTKVARAVALLEQLEPAEDCDDDLADMSDVWDDLCQVLEALR